MQTIAITGISGYIGSRLLSRLADIAEIKKIIGIDIKPPGYNLPKLQFYRQDVTSSLTDIFVENNVDTAVHLAFVLKPTRDRRNTERIDVTGIRNFLEACQQAQVGHILYLSSHTVYGAYPDNPLPLEENWPLRPLPDFQYSWDKVQTEKILKEFVGSNDNICVTILRSCPVIGPNAGDSVVSLMFKPPMMIGIARFDPLMQFIHEDDLLELMMSLLVRKIPGTFNVAGDGEIKYSQIAKIAGKKMLLLPEIILKPLMKFSWLTHLQSDSPPSGLEFVKYPPIVSTEKLKKVTGFQFRYSSQQALASFVPV